MTESSIKKEIERLVKFFIEEAEKKYGKTMPKPIIKYNINSAHTAGQFCYPNVIRFNLPMCKLNYDAFMNDTVGHEVAHLVQHQLHYGCQAHGDVWKSVMRFFGLQPNRCHNMNTNGLGRKSSKVYAYTCNCDGGRCVHYLTPYKHNKVAQGASYLCSQCRGRLKRVSALDKK